MPSFDIVSEVDGHEIKNSVDQTNKEIKSRFDFKGTDARVEQADFILTIYADDKFKLEQVEDILRARLTKRKIDVRCLEMKQLEKISGNKVKQEILVRTGLNTELAKKIAKILKESKLKVQASIQGDSVRVSGSKKDVLQDAIQVVKKTIVDFPLQYHNFRN